MLLLCVLELLKKPLFFILHILESCKSYLYVLRHGGHGLLCYFFIIDICLELLHPQLLLVVSQHLHLDLLDDVDLLVILRLPRELLVH